MIVMAAAGIYVVEGRAQPEVFSSIPASMWWAAVSYTHLDVYKRQEIV